MSRGTELDRVLALTGATYRQLDYWCRQGWLEVGMPGSGHWREWPLSEIRVAETMARLTRAGIKPAAAARIARGERELAPGIIVQVGP